MMIAKFSRAGIVVPALVALSLGLLGCDGGGSGEIPLAKVPPPPADFGKVQKDAKTPKGASPADTSQYTK